MQTPQIQSKNHDDARNGERGSVLIYIFIAIVVFAALSFAVSRGNREGVATVDRERADLQATQILDYTGMIRRSLQNMKINGIKDTELCFDHTSWGFATYNHAGCSKDANKVFLPKGGGSSFQAPGNNYWMNPYARRPDGTNGILPGPTVSWVLAKIARQTANVMNCCWYYPM